MTLPLEPIDDGQLEDPEVAALVAELRDEHARKRLGIAADEPGVPVWQPDGPEGHYLRTDRGSIYVHAISGTPTYRWSVYRKALGEIIASDTAPDLASAKEAALTTLLGALVPLGDYRPVNPDVPAMGEERFNVALCNAVFGSGRDA